MKKKTVVVLFILMFTLFLTACNSRKYEKACHYLVEKRYQEASEIFKKLGDYENSIERNKECLTYLALEKYGAGQIEVAIRELAEIQDFELAQKALRKIQYEWIAESGYIYEGEQMADAAALYSTAFTSKVFEILLTGGTLTTDYDDPQLISMEEASKKLSDIFNIYESLFPTEVTGADPFMKDLDDAFRAMHNYGSTFFTKEEFVKWVLTQVGGGLSSEYSMKHYEGLIAEFQSATDALKNSV